MKWFTPEWHGGGLTHDEGQAVVADYNAHVQALLGRLPLALRVLAKQRDRVGVVGLHDAVVEWWAFDLPRSLTLQVFAGSDFSGYRRVVIHYHEQVELLGGPAGTIAGWLDDPKTEFLYDEVDLAQDGRFEHRHLLWPAYREFGVRFADITLVAAPVPGRTWTVISRRRRLESSRLFDRALRASEAATRQARRLRRGVDDAVWELRRLRG